jgi:CheY-like chemotaxis protein
METKEKKERRILIVDDDQFLLNMYTVKFKNSGFEIDAVSGGSFALEKLKSGVKYDAILFDIVMPGMDGFELAETIKKDNLQGGAALIVLSNQNQSTDIDKFNALGVDGYIVKASTIPSEVVKEVNLILSKKS